MMMMPTTIPLGFHFMPTDEELVTFFLRRRAAGLPHQHHQHIVEKNLYGDKADPWWVFEDVSDSYWDISSEEDHHKRVIYVFTKLSKISKGKTRIARRAGCGTWSGQTPPKKIYDESTGQWVGTMRMLSFERRDDDVVMRDPRDQHHWIMHEYSLDGIYNNSKDPCQDYVICRITRVLDKTTTRSCVEECPQPAVSSGKKRSSQDQEETATICSSVNKKQNKAMISSPAGEIMQLPAAVDHRFLEAQMMLADLPLSNPAESNEEEWTQEDLDILDHLLGDLA